MTQQAADAGDAAPTEAERLSFRASLRGLALESIRDRVLSGQYGAYDPTDPRRSAWRAREANRYITAMQRRAEVRPQWIGIIVSSLLSLAALVVSILAYLKQK